MTALITLLIAGMIIATLGVLALVKLVQPALSLFGNMEQTGVNGIVDTALGILRTIGEGAAKG